MSTSHEASAKGEGPAPVTLFSVPKRPQHAIVRILGKGYGCLTHYVPKQPTLCRGDGACKADLHRKRPQWRGYYPAMIGFTLPMPHWELRILEITERLGEMWWGQNLIGQTWRIERVSEGKYDVMTGHFVKQYDPGHLPRAPLIPPVLQRVYRVMRLPDSIGPQLQGREWAEPITRQRAESTSVPLAARLAIHEDEYEAQVLDALEFDGQALDGQVLDGQVLDGQVLDGQPRNGQPRNGQPRNR